MCIVITACKQTCGSTESAINSQPSPNTEGESKISFSLPGNLIHKPLQRSDGERRISEFKKHVNVRSYCKMIQGFLSASKQCRDWGLELGPWRVCVHRHHGMPMREMVPTRTLEGCVCTGTVARLCGRWCPRRPSEGVCAWAPWHADAGDGTCGQQDSHIGKAERTRRT